MKGAWSRPSPLASRDAEPGPSAPEHARLAGLLLIAIIGSAFIVRLLRCSAGLPYLHEWDEPQTAGAALRMMQTGDYNPHFFNYGSLTIYLNLIVDVFHYFYLMAQPDDAPSFLRNLADIKTRFDTGWHWTISHPSFYFWNRCATAALGTGCVGLTYLMAREIKDRWAGLAAAALLAGLEIHVHHSTLVTPDVPAGFFVLLSVYLAMRYLTHSRVSDLCWSFAAAGLAASTKYNSAVCLLAPVAGLALSAAPRARGYRHWLWAAAPILAGGAFLAATPYAAMDLPAFLNDAGKEVLHYKVMGHGVVTAQAGLPHLVIQARAMAAQLGWFCSMGALLGAVLLAGRRIGWVFLVFPVAYAASMLSTRVAFHRNFVVLYPFAAVGLSTALWWAGETLRRRLPPPRQSVARLRVLFALLVLTLVVPGMVMCLAKGWRLNRERETRTQAMISVTSSAAGASGTRVGVAEELRVHEEDLRRLGGTVTPRPYLDLLCDGARSYDLLVTAAQFAGNEQHNRPRAEFLTSLVPARGEGVQAFGADSPLYLDKLSIDPEVLVFDPRRSGMTGRLVCGDPIPYSTTRMSEEYRVGDRGTLQMLAGGKVTTPAFTVGPGRHAFIGAARGTKARGEYARLVLSVVTAGGPAPETALTEETIVTSSEMTPFVVSWETDSERSIALRIAFVNDAYVPEKKEDRNAYLEPLRLITVTRP